jgi:hypothetical protein
MPRNPFDKKRPVGNYKITYVWQISPWTSKVVSLTVLVGNLSMGTILRRFVVFMFLILTCTSSNSMLGTHNKLFFWKLAQP